MLLLSAVLRSHDPVARVRPIARALLAGLLVTTAGCASVRLEGVSGPIAWRATDLRLETEGVRMAAREVFARYSFELVLKEVEGVAITFTEAESTLYSRHPWSTGGGPSRTSGRWTLPAHGEIRLPVSSTHGCTRDGLGPAACLSVDAPQWRFVLSGTDDRGKPVRVTIDVWLPESPPPGN